MSTDRWNELLPYAAGVGVVKMFRGFAAGGREKVILEYVDGTVSEFDANSADDRWDFLCPACKYLHYLLQVARFRAEEVLTVQEYFKWWREWTENCLDGSGA